MASPSHQGRAGSGDDASRRARRRPALPRVRICAPATGARTAAEVVFRPRVPEDPKERQQKARKKEDGGDMTPIVDQKALEDFIESADLNEVRRVEASLVAMAASVRLRAVELETQPVGPFLKPVASRDS